MFLQVVAFATDVGSHFETVGQTHTANFTQCGVWFFGVVVYTRVHTPRFCGQASSAGTLLLAAFTERGLRTSWLIVAIKKAHGFCFVLAS